MLWAVIGVKMVFYDSTGAYTSPTATGAILGVAFGVGPIVVCICLFYLLWSRDSRLS